MEEIPRLGNYYLPLPTSKVPLNSSSRTPASIIMPGLKLNHGSRRLTRTAFVTIGATAGFRALLREVASPEFLATLKSLNFTDLVVQCGPNLEYFETIKPDDSHESYGVNITAFSYAPDLKHYFVQTSHGLNDDGVGSRDQGVVISHAGPSNFSCSFILS